MKNKIKILAAACICCMLLIGGAIHVFAAGALTVAVSSGTVQAGETVTVTVYAADADNAAVTADMNITYDASKLEYVSSSDTNAAYGNGTVKATGSEVSIKFKGLSSGDAYVKAESASLTAAGTHIMVSGTATNTTTDSNDASTDNAVKSGDNSLTSLTISPGTLSPSFTGRNTEYTAQVSGDVTSITVTPVTSNSKAEIESITGNTDLKEGNNVISVVVKAENGEKATYRITVTKGGAQAANTDSAADSESAEDDQILGNTDAQTQEASAGTVSGEAIVIDGVNYNISEGFTDELIPEGFSRADFEYKGVPHQGVVFDYGHLGMYYLVNDAGEGKFFVYDADRDKFYPYARMTSGEHFIVLMVVPNGVLPPENYEAVTLNLDDGTAVAAYQYAGGEDDEIVVAVDPEAEALVGNADFYIFYAMDETGVSCWYQYDAKQKTYQRFNTEILPSEDSGENYDVLLASYNELDERYKKSKTNSRRIIGSLLVLSVALLFLLINFIIKNRDMKEEDFSSEDTSSPSKKSVPRSKKKETEAQDWRKHIEPVKEEEFEDDSNFYDGDNEDIIDEFEENPVLLTRRPRKKAKREKPKRQESPRKPETQEKSETQEKLETQEKPKTQEEPVEPQEEETEIPEISLDVDDELEFIDLNDL